MELRGRECRACKRRFWLRRRCDRGHANFGPACSERARRESLRRAGRRYQGCTWWIELVSVPGSLRALGFDRNVSGMRGKPYRAPLPRCTRCREVLECAELCDRCAWLAMEEVGAAHVERAESWHRLAIIGLCSSVTLVMALRLWLS